jgi:eukaryotic-like serine/threonine-protein kinase
LKACAQCQRLYGDEAGFCPIDGKELRPVDEVQVPGDPKDPRLGMLLCGGRYQVRRVVADGGMGRVYQAYDVQERRSVALKVLHEDVAADEVAVERFKREFSFSAQLPHAHIVEVFDFKRTEDRSYALVMEFLEGEELRMTLKREKVLAPERVIRMLAQLAVGLDEAHRRNVVHRDIKPDNIFLCGTPEGDVVKLLDFGSVRDNSEGAKKLTILGTTIGSPYYMSPEQAQGLRELDHRADVWSVAAIGYECLTGKLPFPGSSGPAILLSILTKEPEPPSIAGKAHGVPEALDDVLSDALAKDMKTRTNSLGELADRVGEAYGLGGSAPDWVDMPEAELKAAIEEARNRPPPPPWQPAPEAAAPAGAAPLGVPVGVPPTLSPFSDGEDYVMGLPGGPPWGLIAAIAAVVSVVVAVVLYVVLR